MALSVPLALLQLHNIDRNIYDRTELIDRKPMFGVSEQARL